MESRHNVVDTDRADEYSTFKVFHRDPLPLEERKASDTQDLDQPTRTYREAHVYEGRQTDDQPNSQEKKLSIFDRFQPRGNRNISDNTRKKRAYTIPDHTKIDFDQPRKNYERRNYNPNYRYSASRGNYQNKQPFNRHQNEQSRGPNFRRKNVYSNRYNNERQGDRKYPKSKFNHKFSSRGKQFDYNQDKVGGFKAPKHLSTQQQKRRHLKRLRKTAAELASKDVGGFVYKPGMIGLLRPNTPMNTTQFLSKQKKTSPKMNVRHEHRERDSRECFSVCENKYDMTQYEPNYGSRTPDPKLSPLQVPSDFENMSQYSNQDLFFENDCISGTMEGLANYSMFETDPALVETLKNPISNEKSPNAGDGKSKPILTTSFEENIDMDCCENSKEDIPNQTADCDCDYRTKFENSQERISALESALEFKNDYIQQLEKKLGLN